MKNYAITSGKFTGKGNFTGYTAKGERLHVHAAQMSSLGWKSDAEVKFPFFAIGAVKQIGQLNEDATPKVDANNQPVLVDRLTAMSVFATKVALVAAHADDATLDIEVAKAVKESAVANGLSTKEVEALLATV